MSDLLWEVFYKHHYGSEIFDNLYQAAWNFIENIFRTVSKKKRIEVGAIMIIHVTGRKSSYNVHLHIILSMGGVDGISGKWIDIPRLPYDLFHKKWKKYLLDMLEILINRQR